MFSENSHVLKVMRLLLPVKHLIFYCSLLLLVTLLVDFIVLKELSERNSVFVLLAALWGLLLYVFLNLLRNNPQSVMQKKTLLYTIKTKFMRIAHSFFIIVFIVLFLFSAFYSYRVLSV